MYGEFLDKAENLFQRTSIAEKISNWGPQCTTYVTKFLHIKNINAQNTTEKTKKKYVLNFHQSEASSKLNHTGT